MRTASLLVLKWPREPPDFLAIARGLCTRQPAGALAAPFTWHALTAMLPLRVAVIVQDSDSGVAAGSSAPGNDPPHAASSASKIGLSFFMLTSCGLTTLIARDRLRV